MKLAVIGADGRSGKLFVEAALAAGHQIVAGVRGNRLHATEGLVVRRCDATSYDDVVRLIDGCEAVVSLIGHVKDSPAYVQTTAITTILSAMQHQGIGRIISLTGTGVRLPDDTPSLLDYLLNVAVKLVDPVRIRDGIAHFDVLQTSTADWTVIRVLKLTDGFAGTFRLTNTGPAKLLTPRREVAQAILAVLAEKSFVHAAPVVSPAQKD